MKEPKQRPGREKLPNTAGTHMLKALARRGTEMAGEKVREQLKDAAADRADADKEYGAEKLEQGVSRIADKGEQAIRNTAGKAKEVVSEKIKSHFEDERVRDVPVREPNATPFAEPVRETDAFLHPQADPENHIKTKESYSRTQADMGLPPVREKPRNISGRQETGPLVPQEKPVSPDGGGAPAYAPTRAYTGGKKLAETQTRDRAVRRAPDPQMNERMDADFNKNTVKSMKKGTVKTAAKGTVKTTETVVKATGRTVKTAQRTTETTARTVKATAKTAQKTTEVAAKAVKAASQAAARAAKVAAKAVAAAFKALVAALKGLVAAIAAGGWVAVVIILALALVGLLLCTSFGLFSSNETEDGSKPMTVAISQIDMEFKSEIDKKIESLSAGGYDEVVVKYRGDMDGDSAFLTNWNDVLATYAVLLTTDEAAATDVVTVTPEKAEKLREIFREMNTVEYDTEVQTETYTVETEDGEEEEITYSTLYIYITVKSLAYTESAALYRMSAKQFEVAEAMMSPEFASLFAELIGVDVYGGADLTDIISGLPASGKGAEVIRAALTKLGAPYVWGAKGENRFDCSGFVYWAISQVDPALGSRLYTSAAGQAKYCYDRGLSVDASELLPGDIVFWQNLSCEGCSRWNEVHHVGIYIGSGKVIEASSSQGRVLIRDLWSSTNYPLFMFARL